MGPIFRHRGSRQPMLGALLGLALVGACVSLIALGRAHDRSLAKLGVYPPRDPG